MSTLIKGGRVIDPATKEMIVDKNELITENIADRIINAGIEQVEIRTRKPCIILT